MLAGNAFQLKGPEQILAAAMLIARILTTRAQMTGLACNLRDRKTALALPIPIVQA
jgi:hypothetical protein